MRLEGRAWSGGAPIRRVEVSVDSGATWHTAALGQSLGRFAWSAWAFDWDATPGDYELVVRATDEHDNAQPLEQPWNLHGLANNAVQRVAVSVR